MIEHLDRQQKLTINQWKIFAAATIGDMLDFFDFLLIAFVLAFIVKDWHLTYGQSAAILLSSGVSAPLGSLIWGWVGRQDRSAQGHDRHDPQLLDRDRIDGADPGAWLGVFWWSAAFSSGSASPASTRSILPWCRNSCRPPSAAGSPG